MSGLSRDVLKWLQSLDLSLSIKNVKRDFTNGFIIAEILYRYYKYDINMHSYDNGTSIVKRKNNWDLIIKFANKINFPITQEMADNVSNGKNNSANELIELLYTTLTQKQVQSKVLPELTGNIPPFARPTASQLVRDTLKLAGTNASVDTLQTVKTTASLVEQHNKTLRQEKIDDPARFRPKTPILNNTRHIRGSSKAVDILDNEIPQQLQFVKEVHVRQLDDTPMQIRTKSRQSSSPSPVNVGGSALGNSTDFQVHTINNEFSILPIKQIFNNVTVEYLSTLPSGTDLNIKTDPIVAVFDNCNRLPEDWLNTLINSLNDKSEEFSDSILSNPKEFWQFFSLVYTGVKNLDVNSTQFQSLIDFIGIIGEKITFKDSYSSFALFSDYALQQTISIISSQPQKTHSLLFIIYSFVSNNCDEHIKVIKRLEEFIKDSSLLINLLSFLVELEKEFNERLFDTYANYARVSLSVQSQISRVGALFVLNALLNFDNELRFSLNLIDGLVDLAADKSWEVRAQLSIYCTSILQTLNEGDDKCEIIYKIIESIIKKEKDVNVLKIALSNMAGVLYAHPNLLAIFCSLLIYNEELRELLESKDHSVDDALHGEYVLPSLPTIWYPLGIVLTVALEVRKENMNNIGSERIMLLASAIININEFAVEEVDQWKSVFEDLMDYILVELCESRVVDLVILILKKFLYSPVFASTAIKIMSPTPQRSVPPLFGMLKFLFGNTESHQCADTVCEFFQELVTHEDSNHAHPFNSHLVTLLKQFDASEAEMFQNSGLPEVIKIGENVNKRK